MKRLLLYSFFLLYLTPCISKWTLDLGTRINTYVPVLLAWAVVAGVYLSGRKLQLPPVSRTIIILKILFLLSVMVSVLNLLDLGTWGAGGDFYVRGLVAVSVKVASLILIILFIRSLSSAERSILVDLLLLAIGTCAFYTLLQGVGIYCFGVDLDKVVATYLPFRPEGYYIMDDAPLGFGEYGIIYRLTGLCGEPNLNGTILLVSIPLLFYRGARKGSVVLAICVIAILGLITLTLSITALMSTALCLIMSFGKYIRTGTRFCLIVLAGMALGAGLVLWSMHDLAKVVAEWRFNPEGTGESHMLIAGRALQLWREHPFGVGYYNSGVFSEDISMHNTFLQILVEQGLLGFFIMMGLVCYSVWICLTHKCELLYAELTIVLCLTLASLGHDLMSRFEFELFMVTLLILGVAEFRDKKLLKDAMRRDRTGSERSIGSGELGGASVRPT